MKDTLREGMAMVELIFALVVIGITLMSAPLIISQSVQSNFTAFQQESIAIAAAHANTLMSYAWDEQNTDNGLGGTGSNILDVTTRDIDLDRNGTLRGITIIKIPNQQRLRRFSPVVSVASINLRDENPGALRNDVDDFNNVDSSLQLYGIGQQTQIGEYIDRNITIHTAVNYGLANADFTHGDFTFNNPFNAALNIDANNSSNLKRITTTLTSTSQNADLGAKRIVLQAFMCNIGAANPLQSSGN